MFTVLLRLLAIQVFFTAALQAQALIKIDGSSTVFPLSEAVVERFIRDNNGAVKVSVNVSGTTGGFKKFCRGESDIQDASRPILKEEWDVCRGHGIGFVELPIAFDAIVMVTHKQNTWINSLSVSELKRIWEPSAQGKITAWNQINPAWPNQKLTLYGAGGESGTFDYFTEAIVGKARSSRSDYNGSEDDLETIRGVSSDRNSLGYVPYSYYETYKNKLRVIAVEGGPGSPKNSAVTPSPETVKDGSYYPLSRPLFIYVNSQRAARPEVKAFTEFFLKNAALLAKQAKFVPLPLDAYSKSLARFQKLQTGTAFRGIPEIGLHVNEILGRTPAM